MLTLPILVNASQSLNIPCGILDFFGVAIWQLSNITDNYFSQCNKPPWVLALPHFPKTGAFPATECKAQPPPCSGVFTGFS